MNQKASIKKIREENTALIIQTLLKSGGMSRIELAEACGIAPSTVTQVVNSLQEHKLVEEYRIGDSTGGRPPAYIRIVANYGSILIFIIKRDGVKASIYDLAGNEQEEIILSDKQLTGNTLLRAINKVVSNIQSGKTEHPANVISIGLLCQQDIPVQDFMTMYSTSISSDMIPLEVAVHSSFGIPVRKEIIEGFSLDYFVQNCKVSYSNYAYINIGERITACFTLDGKRVEIRGASTFDLTPFMSDKLILDNLLNSEYHKQLSIAVPIHDISLCGHEEVAKKPLLAERIAVAIRSACTFFSADIVFLGGKAKDLDKIASETSRLLEGHPTVVSMGADSKNATTMFLKRLLDNSARILVGH